MRMRTAKEVRLASVPIVRNVLSRLAMCGRHLLVLWMAAVLRRSAEDSQSPVCEHEIDTPDEIYWKYVSSDGWCMVCGKWV
jgi:hypothetical protein